LSFSAIQFQIILALCIPLLLVVNPQFGTEGVSVWHIGDNSVVVKKMKTNRRTTRTGNHEKQRYNKQAMKVYK